MTSRSKPKKKGKQNCYDPKHRHWGVKDYCFGRCSQCERECNPAYWGAAGRRLYLMEKLVIG